MNLKEVKQYIKDEGLDIKCRKIEVLYRRYYLYKYLRVMHRLSLDAIGNIFNQNHATVLNGLNQFDVLFKYGNFWNIVYKEFDLFFIDSSITYNQEILQYTNIIKWNLEDFKKINDTRINERLESNEEAIKFIVNDYIRKD